ncbi:hypothetical protein DM860_005931 [Cuscuta australis]|uniref:Peptidase A1 domain-containing protein n=1 Tax=Cuscuta australis TaxID=267555 RepID=A0A328DS31_9ASTE|nr:hypothetical protein DM860_005931 [Cuscuta australis]
MSPAATVALCNYHLFSLFFITSSSCFPLLLLFLARSSEGAASSDGGALSQSAAATANFRTAPLTSLLPPTTCRPPSPNANKGLRGGRAASLKDELRVHSIHARVNSDKTNPLRDSLKKKRSDPVADSKANVPAARGTALGSGNYIVSVGIGTPKKSLSLVFDTGSDLTWTQCLPCAKSCYSQKDRIFDPKFSGTYSNVSCSSAACSGLKAATGNEPDCASSTCVYGIEYGDSSFSVGFFVRDRLSLTPSDIVENFLFGCGQNNQGLFGSTAGLLGLGRDALSVVSQTAGRYGSYFSYCLATKSGSEGHLTFGRSGGGASGSVRFTPFAKGNAFYFIEVQSIIMGGKQLPISPVVFQTAGMIIDSGTVITRLPQAAYSALRSAFQQGMGKYPTAPGVSILDTCYDLSNYTTVTVPKISLVLSGAVSLDLPFAGILMANGAWQVCLAYAGNGDAGDMGILGNTQQQTFEVVYDVAGGKLGIGAGGCT